MLIPSYRPGLSQVHSNQDCPLGPASDQVRIQVRTLPLKDGEGVFPTISLLNCSGYLFTYLLFVYLFIWVLEMDPVMGQDREELCHRAVYTLNPLFHLSRQGLTKLPKLVLNSCYSPDRV